MRFNLKLVEYQDTATISVFDDLVGFDDDYIRPPPIEKEEPVIIEPFTNTVVTEIKDEVEEFKDKMYSLEKSVQRSKRNVLNTIRSMNLKNAYFVTLTFDSKKIDRRNFTLCCKKTRVWLQNRRKIKGAENMSFLCVPELHKDMVSWHMHLIMCDVGEMPLTDSGHKDHTGKTIYNLDGWRYGFSTAIRIETDAMTSIKLSKYVTKYFTKESALIAHNRHRYFASQNIPKPKVTKWSFDTEEEKERILSKILNSGYKAVSESHYDGFVGIDYIEAIKDG